MAQRQVLSLYCAQDHTDRPLEEPNIPRAFNTQLSTSVRMASN